jgi:SpoVK/Ycf46/Vps4 family AAA+-type ATPase
MAMAIAMIYCDDCSKCSDCDRVDLDDGYGYCEDCKERYTEDEIEDIKEEAREEGFRRAIEQIKSKEIEDKGLKTALKKWKEAIDD